MGLIPQHFIDDLIARADIVEVIGGRVPLKKAGREFKACCPFHTEKTPSFTVSQTKQFYHCFGCGAHGTALGFLMEYDRLSFVEAVEELASRLGLEVPREAGTSARNSTSNDLHELMARVAQFYRDALKDDARAVGYLKERGLAGETAARFGIGYAPDSWNAVLMRFGESEAGRRKLSAAGLIIERSGPGPETDGGFYDRFRDRIMFPIRDARGRVIAFGGRIIDKGEPKYLNSPETSLFHKGQELYGVYEVRQSRQALNRLLIVEGYMDVLRLHQSGITFALATLGTATTAEHLNRVFRLTSEVVFCFDGDRAGRAAAWRAMENALPLATAGRRIKFMFLPESHDPDTLIGEEGREAFEARIAAAIPLHKYMIQSLQEQAGLGPASRPKLIASAKALVGRMPADAYRDETVRELAKSAGIDHVREVLKWIDEFPAAGGAPDELRKSSGVSARTSSGRGSVVRQAIVLLLNFPESALEVSRAEGLAGLSQPGVSLLAELIANLKQRSAPHKAAVVERWRERPEGHHLMKLASTESLVTDPKAATRELQMAIDKLLDATGPAERTDELLRKAEDHDLTAEEKLELQELLKARKGPKPDLRSP